MGKYSTVQGTQSARVTGAVRDRIIKTINVPCPQCGAAAGETCLSTKGKLARHTCRRVMALRAEAETR